MDNESDLKARIKAVIYEIAKLHLDGDPESSKLSVRNCGLMAKMWSLQTTLLGLQQLRGKVQDEKAWRYASQAARDWEQRKAAALSNQMADDYKALLEKIEADERAAEDLLNLDNNDD